MLIHCGAKGIYSFIKITEFWCSNHFHRCINQAHRHADCLCKQECSEFQRGTVRGCHLSNKSSRDISSLLNIPQSSFSVEVIGNDSTKWLAM